MAKAKKNTKINETAPIEEKEVKTPTAASQRVKDRPKKAPMKSPLELQQLDGKLYNKYGVQSVDELLGIKDNKYDTHDIKVYKAGLEKMNMSDLQRHAISLQIIPKEDRRILTQLLLKQFRVANSSQLNEAKEIPMNNMMPPQDVLDILAEGR